MKTVFDQPDSAVSGSLAFLAAPLWLADGSDAGGGRRLQLKFDPPTARKEDDCGDVLRGKQKDQTPDTKNLKSSQASTCLPENESHELNDLNPDRP